MWSSKKEKTIASVILIIIPIIIKFNKVIK